MKKIKKIVISTLFFIVACCTLSTPTKAATKEYKAKVAQARKYAESDPETMQLTTEQLTFKKPGQAFGIKLYQADKYSHRGWRLVSAFTLIPDTIEVSQQDRMTGSFRIKALAPTPENGITLVAYFKNKYTSKRVCLPLSIIVKKEDKTPSKHAHQWSTAWTNDDVAHWHDCSAEGCTIIANSEKDGYAEHVYGKWVIDTAATINKAGSRHRDCSICAYRQTESIPATGSSSSGNSGSTGNAGNNSGNNGGNDKPSNPGGNPIQPPVVNPGEDLPSVDPKPENPGTTTPPAITTPPSIIVTPPAIELVEVDRSNWRVISGSSIYDGMEHASSMEGIQSNIGVRREIRDAAGNVVANAVNAGNYTTTFYFDVPEGYKEVEPIVTHFEIEKRDPAVKLAYDETTNSVRVVSEILDTDVENLNMQLDGINTGEVVSLAGRDLGQHRVSATISIKGDKMQNYANDSDEFKLSGLYNIENQHAWARFSAVPTKNGNQVVVTLYAEGIQIPKGTARTTTVVTTAMKILYDDSALEAVAKSDGVSSSGWHTSYAPSDGAYDLTSYHIGTVSSDQRYILGTITFNVTGDPGENGIRIRLADTFINVDGDKTNPFKYNVDSRVVTVVPPENYSDGTVLINKNDSLSVNYKDNVSDPNKEASLDRLEDFVQNNHGENISITVKNP